jgi:hypothetical protein
MCYMKNERFADGGEGLGRASVSHQCQGSEHHHNNVRRSVPATTTPRTDRMVRMRTTLC